MQVLLIEDNPDDIASVRRLMAASGQPIHLVAAESGGAGLAYLRQQERDGAQMVLLDIHLPDGNGLDVLRRLKADPALGDIPVVILTASERDQDVRDGMELGAHGHFNKPMRDEDFFWITTSVRNYWDRLNNRL